MYERLVGRVPKDWSTTTLGELCKTGGGGIQTGPFGSQLHASDYVSSGIPVVMPQNIGDNVINERGIARVRPSDAARLDRHLLRAGDIVYSRRGDVERRALVRPIEDGWLCGTGCLRVRVGNAANPAFISYFLGHPEVRRWIVKHAVGATMPNLNTAILSSVPLILPPRHTQDGIAAVLGVIDDKIALNDRIIRTCDALCGAFFQRMLGSSDIRYVKIEEIADINRESVKPNRGGHLRYLDISSVSLGSINWPERMSWEYAPSRARRKASQWDTLWSTVRPGRRSYALILENDPELVVSTGFCVITPRAVGPASLYEVVRRDEFVEYLESMSEGSAYPAVRPERIAQAVVPLPQSSELQKFERHAMKLRRRIRGAEAETRNLARIRHALLPKLISGEIGIRDAEQVAEEVT